MAAPVQFVLHPPAMTDPAFLSVAEKTDLLFRRMRKPNGRRYIYDDVPGASNSAISRLRRGGQEEPFFWVMVNVARTFGVPLTYFSDELTHDQANELLDWVEGRPQQMREEERVRLETANTLATLAVRCAQMAPDQVSRLRTWLDQVPTDLT